VNKPSPPTESRRLDAQAIQTLGEVAAEFAVFNSTSKEKCETQGGSASILTSMLADAVDQPHVDIVTLADKPQQRADAFAAHLVWLSEASLLPGQLCA
jgi:sulfate adenylyltransferase subunit 1 (EFTu-like GTPase family)